MLQIWSFDKEKAFQSLNTSEKGLSENEANFGLKGYGTNTFHNKKVCISIFFKQFKSPLIFLLSWSWNNNFYFS